MKKFFAAILALITCMLPLSGALPDHGRDLLARTEETYRKGGYDTFLAQLDEQYRKAGDQGLLKEVFETGRDAPKPEWTESDSEQIRTRNLKLLEIAKESPDEAISEKIDHVIFFSLQPDYQTVMKELEELRYHLPETNEGTLENKISHLETEYNLKKLLLEIAQTRSGTPPEELAQKKFALTLEKLDKMRDAAREKGSQGWQNKLDIALRAHRLQTAYLIDLGVIKGLAQDRHIAHNPVEEKVKGVMVGYLQQDPLLNNVALVF